MSSVSQNPSRMPKPTGPSRDEVKARVYAKIEAEKALPASERIANVLHATHTTAEAQDLLNRFRAEVLREAANEVDTTASEMERVLGRTLETSSVERGVANRIRRMADLAEGGAR